MHRKFQLWLALTITSFCAVGSASDDTNFNCYRLTGYRGETMGYSAVCIRYPASTGAIDTDLRIELYKGETLFLALAGQGSKASPAQSFHNVGHEHDDYTLPASFQVHGEDASYAVFLDLSPGDLTVNHCGRCSLSAVYLRAHHDYLLEVE